MNNKLIEGLIYSPVANFKTKRIINKKIKEIANPKIKKELTSTNNLNWLKECKPYKGKIFFGNVVEINACKHYWLNNEMFHIYHAVDMQTRMLLAIHAEKEETTLWYYKLLRKVFIIVNF